MTPDPRELLPVALTAADTARDLIRTSGPAIVTEKSDRDLVSDIDVAVERAVRAYLHQATPGIGVLGEEEGGPETTDTGWLWTLDPIDGTSNFAHGVPLCATSLALLRDGRPVLGVIDAPFLSERYHATEGHGAWNGTRRLAASTTTSLRDAIVAIGDYATGHEAGRKNQARLAATIQLTSRVHRIRMLGTAAIDLAWLADGKLDASITLANQPWDMAAGVIIAREAGATVVDLDGSPHNLRSAATIAAPDQLIAQLIQLVQTASTPHHENPDDQVTGAPPYADLDEILSRARYLIFDFDGPVRDLADEGPAPYIYEALAACRDSGRIPAIIAAASHEAVTAYLVRHGLDDQVQHVGTPDGNLPGRVQPNAGLLPSAIRELGASPSECALITATAATIHDARTIGLPTIAYAATPEADDQIADADADSLLPSLADLTLRLRARPLPN